MRGILDRFEDQDKAVILIEDEKEEVIIPASDLPEGSKVNTYFKMEKQDGTYRIISIDESATEEEAQKTSDLMAKLRAKKGNGSKFKK
ncbi:DUF3006 domain-containing protein [Ornithinibacillus halophilus]|uniref:DUF3006 domain-containing protein n=1 Tax=Ornithinibacillus halophilus TaxID=930117 RepID=A0A1M5J6C9_9BACI|nr:DUF3006 domain-containing protein [Ornithinibacillus halophilus]SHG35915.1 Protein of unknown function [Ornithinibacillus halophilus]